MTTQKAYRLHSYGGPECLQLDDTPIPTPGPSQALVAVSKVGMNPFDWKIREGHVKDFLPLQLPTILGVDFVGTIASLPEGGSKRGLKVGDRVMTMSGNLGAFAEYTAVDESILARVPDQLDDVQAATLPVPAMSAWAALYAAGPVPKGSRILIHGASGTVGAFAIQFAKAEGAHVIATASGKNKGYVMDLGADEFIDYQTQKFEEVLAKDIDLILDFVLVGNMANTTDRSWKVLKPNGALVSVADPALIYKIPEGYRGFFPEVEKEVDAEVLERIAGMLVEGRVKAKVARVFKRGELVEAMEINRAGRTTGRLIVDFEKV
jgi:NADPH:quinone reductase-like Zn-dependent oxidoreductase